MKIQIGKSGVSEALVKSLDVQFNHHKIIRISVLRNYAPTKEKVREIADSLVSSLGETETTKTGKYAFKYIIVGFTIILKRIKKVGA